MCCVWFGPCAAIGVSTNCCSEVYCGTGPLSTPEAAAVTRYVEQRKEELLCFLTIHSYGQLILVPYGNPNLTASNYEELVKGKRWLATSLQWPIVSLGDGREYLHTIPAVFLNYTE